MWETNTYFIISFWYLGLNIALFLFYEVSMNSTNILKLL